MTPPSPKKNKSSPKTKKSVESRFARNRKLLADKIRLTKSKTFKLCMLEHNREPLSNLRKARERRKKKLIK